MQKYAQSDNEAVFRFGDRFARYNFPKLSGAIPTSPYKEKSS